MNKMMGISVYWSHDLGLWAFDDKRHGLIHEPFVQDMTNIISEAVVSYIGEDVDKFRIMFSANDFPGSHSRLIFKKEENDGAWYQYQKSNGKIMDGWLCPALYHYFAETPSVIHFRVENVVKW
jgi:hypothetical protein